MENDLSPDVLVGGLTNKSLHTEITSFINFLSGVGNSLILTTMSSKQKKSASFSSTFKISSWAVNIPTSTSSPGVRYFHEL